jgi:hypothetical protein
LRQGADPRIGFLPSKKEMGKRAALALSFVSTWPQNLEGGTNATFAVRDDLTDQ